MMDTAQRHELHLGDALYPQLLSQIDDPPAVLYCIGDPEALRPGLSIVGARRATPYGTHAADIFATWAANAGYPVYSGGAVGCDQAAHRAALRAAGVTGAVMAGGADVAYPAQAKRLFSDIVREGAIVSEMPWGTRPLPYMFRRRNRLIAGLAAALLVVEAGLPSGTLSTADYALAAGRDVLVVPGSIFSPTSRGCNRLLSQGARPILDASDLRDALWDSLGPPASDRAWVPSDAVAGRDALAASLLADPMRPDDAAELLGLDVVSVISRIGALEAQGVLARYPDGRYGPGAVR